MTMPKEYSPEHGYMYQILVKFGSEAYEHLDYAVDRADLAHLLKEYRMAYSSNPKFKHILLPKKYHPKAVWKWTNKKSGT